MLWEKGLALAFKKKFPSRKQFQELNSLEKKTAGREIKKMIEAGLIVRKGSGPSTYYEIIATKSLQIGVLVRTNQQLMKRRLSL